MNLSSASFCPLISSSTSVFVAFQKRPGLSRKLSPDLDFIFKSNVLICSLKLAIFIDISDIKNLNFQTVNNNSDLATLACKIDTSKQDKYSNSNIVKVVTQEDLQKKSISKAVKFERIIDAKKNNYIYQHIGIYIYKKSILKKFVKLNQTENEKVKKLEQLRALENGINIDVAYAKTIPIGVDTKEDYVELKNLMEYKK